MFNFNFKMNFELQNYLNGTIPVPDEISSDLQFDQNQIDLNFDFDLNMLPDSNFNINIKNHKTINHIDNTIYHKVSKTGCESQDTKERLKELGGIITDEEFYESPEKWKIILSQKIPQYKLNSKQVENIRVLRRRFQARRHAKNSAQKRKDTSNDQKNKIKKLLDKINSLHEQNKYLTNQNKNLTKQNDELRKQNANIIDYVKLNKLIFNLKN